MKGTEHFKQAIKAYLDERAKTDERLRDIHTQPGNGNL